MILGSNILECWTKQSFRTTILGLAQIFNKFYANVKINVSDEKVKNTNFMIAHATRIVINEGLRLLGIEFVEQM